MRPPQEQTWRNGPQLSAAATPEADTSRADPRWYGGRCSELTVTIWYLLMGRWTPVEEIDGRLAIKVSKMITAVGPEKLKTLGKDRLKYKEEAYQLGFEFQNHLALNDDVRLKTLLVPHATIINWNRHTAALPLIPASPVP